MSSVERRECLEKTVNDLLELGKTDTEIATELGYSVSYIGDIRRRLKKYKIAVKSATLDLESDLIRVVIVEHKPKAYPYRDQFGKLWLDVSEFFGI